MSVISTLAFRNGFPFPIPRVAEDGKPFSRWDGSTVYAYDPIMANSGLKFIYPSKSSSEYTTVYGDGANFCLRLTRAQLAELYWRAKGLTLTVKNPSVVTGHVLASAVSGHWDISETWVDDSGSSRVDDMSLEVDDWKFYPFGIPASGCIFRRDKMILYGGNYITAHEQQILLGDFSPVSSVYDRDGNLIVDSFSIQASKTSTNTGSLTTSASLVFTSTLPDTTHNTGGNALDIIPNQYNVIQTGDNEYWLAPGFSLGVYTSRRLLPNFDNPVNGDFYITYNAGTVVAVASGSSTQYTTDGTYPDISSGGLTNRSRGLRYVSANWINIGYLANVELSRDVGAYWPYEIILSSGTITGKQFGIRQTFKAGGERSDGGAVDASVDEITRPTMSWSISKFWTHGGHWDEDSGVLKI